MQHKIIIKKQEIYDHTTSFLNPTSCNCSSKYINSAIVSKGNVILYSLVTELENSILCSSIFILFSNVSSLYMILFNFNITCFLNSEINVFYVFNVISTIIYYKILYN